MTSWATTGQRKQAEAHARARNDGGARTNLNGIVVVARRVARDEDGVDVDLEPPARGGLHGLVPKRDGPAEGRAVVATERRSRRGAARVDDRGQARQVQDVLAVQQLAAQHDVRPRIVIGAIRRGIGIWAAEERGRT